MVLEVPALGFTTNTNVFLTGLAVQAENANSGVSWVTDVECNRNGNATTLTRHVYEI